MYYVDDTVGESMFDMQKRLHAFCKSPGVLGGVIAIEDEVPDFAIDATPDYDNL